MSRLTLRHPYRHVYGIAGKAPTQFLDLNAPMTSGEANFVACNSKYITYASAGAGSTVYVLKADEPRRVGKSAPIVAVHRGNTLDFAFNPFMEQMLGTVGEDASAKMTVIDPLWAQQRSPERRTTADVVLRGHSKKVTLLRFHPVASNVVATASFDRTVKVWNIEKSAELCSFNAANDTVYSSEWNGDGSQMAATSKDKHLYVFDPRAPDDFLHTDSFDGTKSSKVFHVDALNLIGATGFSRTAKRQLKLWDVRKMQSTIYSENVDSASSVQMPHYDAGNALLYIYSKGGGQISFAAILKDSKIVHHISAYRNSEPQKGGNWAPKRAMDVWKCEVARFYKLTRNSIVPVSFIVPRKAGGDVFQEDIYPDTASQLAALSADEFEAGQNARANLMSLDPAKRSETDVEMTFSKKKTYDELLEENLALRNEVADLKAQLAALSADDDARADDSEDTKGMDEVPKAEELSPELASAATAASDE